MSISGERIETILEEFEENTEGVLGCSIITASDALLLAESSQKYDRMVIGWLGEKILSLAKESLEQLLGKYTLKSVTIEEGEHMIYLKPINNAYYAVIITSLKENKGLVEFNLKKLLEKLQPILV